MKKHILTSGSLIPMQVVLGLCQCFQVSSLSSICLDKSKVLCTRALRIDIFISVTTRHGKECIDGSYLKPSRALHKSLMKHKVLTEL